MRFRRFPSSTASPLATRDSALFGRRKKVQSNNAEQDGTIIEEHEDADISDAISEADLKKIQKVPRSRRTSGAGTEAMLHEDRQLRAAKKGKKGALGLLENEPIKLYKPLREIVVVQEHPKVEPMLTALEAQRRKKAMAMVDANKEWSSVSSILFKHSDAREIAVEREKKQAAYDDAIANLTQVEWEQEQSRNFDNLSPRDKKDYLERSEREEDEDDDDDDDFLEDEDEEGEEYYPDDDDSDWSDRGDGGYNPLD